MALRDANTKGAEAVLSSQHVHPGINLLRHIPCIVSDLPKLDLLHPMQIGMFHDLQKSIFHIIKMHEWLDMYNVMW
jgi:hypothetical protein